MKEIEAMVLSEEARIIIRIHDGKRTIRRVVVKKKLSDYKDRKGRVNIEKLRRDALNEVVENV